jgi:uncharacterized protein
MRLWIPLALSISVFGCQPKVIPSTNPLAHFNAQTMPALRTVTVAPEQGKPPIQLQFAQVHGQAKDAGVDILFLHGSPGSWTDWAPFMKASELLERTHQMRAVDRPGFGLSSDTAVMPNLQAQAKALAGLLSPQRKTIVVGHSLGGPLALWMALNDPTHVCAVVSVAGSTSSKHEAPRWYNQLANTWVAGKLLPDDLLRSNKEMMPLQNELRLLEAKAATLRRPFVAILGMEDSLVAPETADELVKIIPAQHLNVKRIAKMGHFLHWESPSILNDTLLEVLQQVEASACDSRFALQSQSQTAPP